MTVDGVIKYWGSQAAAAAALGLTQPTIANWRARGGIPKLQQLRIEAATGGKLKAAAGILPKARKVSRL